MVYVALRPMQIVMHAPLLILINIYMEALIYWLTWVLQEYMYCMSNWTNCLCTCSLSTLCVVFTENITVRTFMLLCRGIFFFRLFIAKTICVICVQKQTVVAFHFISIFKADFSKYSMHYVCKLSTFCIVNILVAKTKHAHWKHICKKCC